MQLGITAKDRITGFQGIITGICNYISGCSQALLVPPVSDTGTWQSPQWFDVQRLERVGTDLVILDNGESPGCDLAPPMR